MSLSKIIASGIYSGYGLVMPGTWGTLLGLAIWSGVIPFVSWEAASIFCCLMFFLGLWASYRELECIFHDPDPSYIVIDEIVGVGIPLIFAWHFISPPTIAFITSFLAFRYFDILKIWPISFIERFFARRSRFYQALGIMVDDVIAGVMALIMLVVIQQLGLL